MLFLWSKNYIARPGHELLAMCLDVVVKNKFKETSFKYCEVCVIRCGFVFVFYCMTWNL